MGQQPKAQELRDLLKLAKQLRTSLVQPKIMIMLGYSFEQRWLLKNEQRYWHLALAMQFRLKRTKRCMRTSIFAADGRFWNYELGINRCLSLTKRPTCPGLGAAH